MNPIWLIGLAAIWLAGCAPADKMTAPSNAASPEKTVARQAIEGFTGKTSVDAGQRTKAKINDIKAQRRENFEEISP